MDLHLLPAPIAYVRHLVDVEYDDRAKFDQLRVLAQNMLQLMAAILINDCLRMKLTNALATPPMQKKLAAGDFATFVSQAAGALISHVEQSYVPELVRLYGEPGKSTRQRRTRIMRIVETRNRDAHTASLAQTTKWLHELSSDVDDALGELDFLRSYVLVAAKSVELTPDRRSCRLNGVRCHGVSDRYVPIQLPIEQAVSRSEVILVKLDGSDWLSLRPWFLYLDGDVGVGGSGEELTLLNRVNDRRLDYVGLISGTEYQPDSKWRSFTVYELAAARVQPVSEFTHEVIETNLSDSQDPGSESELPIDSRDHDGFSGHLQRLASSYENVVVQTDNGSPGGDLLISIRTPVREVAVAALDASGIIWIYPNMLKRAEADGLITKARLNRVLKQLGPASSEEILRGTALLDIGHISERAEWLGNLASEFSS